MAHSNFILFLNFLSLCFFIFLLLMTIKRAACFPSSDTPLSIDGRSIACSVLGRSFIILFICEFSGFSIILLVKGNSKISLRNAGFLIPTLIPCDDDSLDWCRWSSNSVFLASKSNKIVVWIVLICVVVVAVEELFLFTDEMAKTRGNRDDPETKHWLSFLMSYCLQLLPRNCLRINIFHKYLWNISIKTKEHFISHDWRIPIESSCQKRKEAHSAP